MLQALLREIEAIAARAAVVIAAEAARGAAAWWAKADGSPVTRTDRLAEDCIFQQLAGLLPDVPIVAEERVAEHGSPRVTGGRYVLVDALDGTREFIRGSSEFTVNVALIENGVPVLGVVAVPLTGALYGGADGNAHRGAFDAAGRVTVERRIAVRRPPAELTALVSVSHSTPATEALLARLPVGSRRSVGSSLKFCMIACGEADVYPRGGATSQWDTAAGDAVLRAAGGCTLTLDGEWLRYEAPGEGAAGGYENPPFVAFGGGPYDLRVLLS